MIPISPNSYCLKVPSWSGIDLRHFSATDSGLSAATETSAKPFLLLDKQTTFCHLDTHPAEQSFLKMKANGFTDLSLFPNVIFNAVSHPERLSLFPLRSQAVSVPELSIRVSKQHKEQSPGGGRLPTSASDTAPSWHCLGKCTLCIVKSDDQLSYAVARQE